MYTHTGNTDFPNPFYSNNKRYKITWGSDWWSPIDFGISEWLTDKFGTQIGKINPNQNAGGRKMEKWPQYKFSVPKPTTDTTQKTTTNPPPGGQPSREQPSGGQSSGNNNGIDEAAAAQQRAAAAAAEAKRQAAERSYKGKVEAAGVAKSQAKGQYDWLIGALGSNKQDLLNQVTQNETTGLANYDLQQKQTQQKYDTSKQEILQTYRDLQLEQEKVMRGSGQGQSSRAQEATLRLNNLLGKDMSNITTNEADSLALIGNAVTAFKTQTLNTKTSIEKDTSSKIDKATLDYNQNIQNIDLNTNLSANEREDAYAAAEAQLAIDTANIQTWASQQKLEYQKTVASQTGVLNDYIVNMTGSDKLLNSNVQIKTDYTSKTIADAGITQLDTETGLAPLIAGVYQSPTKTYNSKEELDASGLQQSNPMEYQRQLTLLQSGSQPAIVSTSTPSAMARGTILPTNVQNDPLLRAMFA